MYSESTYYDGYLTIFLTCTWCHWVDLYKKNYVSYLY